ncbi:MULTISPECIES: hypothetical protein [Photorhabdus]|uniref:Bacteriophage protein n=2 Tax=Photorhabdus TaxID=29487 RepID=A0A7X5QN98_9GAMM|nr:MULTISPECIES: hypothetical protein [Photorhabdus]ETS31237.1 hypothetical protein PTE_03192 [Photorhabdus khanii NC19]NHB97304.1 hypothetical protein [Photorhabdus stackebrandtii]
MRYRREIDNDYVFGRGEASFLINSPETVAQAVKTRLMLRSGEWFLDDREGTDYDKVLGKGTSSFYDLIIRQRILQTQGVSEIIHYRSERNPNTRKITITATIDTIYGQTGVTADV